MDEQVASARAHWAPRFTANGVPVADFERVLAGIERWDQWCSAWCDAASRHEQLGRTALAEAREQSAAEHFATAAVLYHFAKFVFVVDREQMRAAHESAVRCYDLAIERFDRPGSKVRIPFDGAELVAIHRTPAGEGPFPTVLMVPGLDSAKEELRSTEELFLQRGLATFTLDGPGQGESEYALPIRGDWEQVARVVVDAMVALPAVDAEAIGVWGVSLGGYYAPRMASGEPRLRACVSLCGPYSFGEIWDQLPELTRDTFTSRSGSADDEAGRRAALRLSMAGRTELVECPTLVVSGQRDRLIPWQQQRRLADEIARSEFLLLPEGNHGCANVLAQHRYLTADWMASRLGLDVPLPAIPAP